MSEGKYWPRYDLQEKLARIKMLTECFKGYGLEATKERIKLYGNATAFVPAGWWYENGKLVEYRPEGNLLERALVAASQRKANGFIPSPGELFDACRDLAKGDPLYSPTQGSTYSEPQWLQWQRRASSLPAGKPRLTLHEGGNQQGELM